MHDSGAYVILALTVQY